MNTDYIVPIPDIPRQNVPPECIESSFGPSRTVVCNNPSIQDILRNPNVLLARPERKGVYNEDDAKFEPPEDSFSNDFQSLIENAHQVADEARSSYRRQQSLSKRAKRKTSAGAEAEEISHRVVASDSQGIEEEEYNDAKRSAKATTTHKELSQ